MTTISELMQWIDGANIEAPDAAVLSAIAVYQAAAAVIDEYNTVKDAAKKLIMDVMEETGQMKFVTLAGTAGISGPS